MGTSKLGDSGIFRFLKAVPVEIPTMLALDRGAYFRFRYGIRGRLVLNARGIVVVYMICEPAITIRS